MNRNGFSLIELSVVLALIGLTATLAAVNLSSSDAALRSYLKDYRFVLEKAKQESLARNVPLDVALLKESAMDEEGFTDDDRSWVLYEDVDGVDGYSVDGGDEEIDRFPIRPSIVLAGDTGLRFSPLGESRAASLDLQVAEPVDYARCESECLALSYNVRVNHVGGIRIGPKEETCASCYLCGSCY